jgi:hypothetical protein
MILWIASFPRSGNTFFRILFNRIYGKQTYSIYNSTLNEQELSVLPKNDLLKEGCWHGRSLASLSSDPKTYFLKTHEPSGEDSFPGIYLVRDGRDALVSYSHFIIEFEKQNKKSHSYEDLFYNNLRNLITLDDSFGGWKNNVSSWAERKAPTKIIKFEDLISNPADIIQQSLKEIGFKHEDLSNNPLPTFNELQAGFPKSFRKGKINAWHSEMPEELQELFWKKNGETMERFGYEKHPKPR